MTAPEILVTERLRGERLAPRHHDLVAPIFADPRVGATMGGVWSDEQVANDIARVGAHWERYGFGIWVFFLGDEAVARGGLQHAEFDGRPEIEVAWTTAPEHWGKGFATELGRAAVDVAFGTLSVPELVAFTLPHNGASRRVMEKLDFVYEKTAPYKGYGDHVLYRRTRTWSLSGA